MAKGGIVFDSDPYDEWMETINKLGVFTLLLVHNSPVKPPCADRCLTTGANTHCITSAEEKHLAEQTEEEVDSDKSKPLEGDAKPRISVAA